MTHLASGILKEFGPVILGFAFDFVRGMVDDLDGDVWRMVTPVVSEMLDAAQTQVMLYGVAGVVDEYGRLTPEFRSPFEHRLLQVLAAAGLAESV